jgi:hypothetical protein
MTPSREMKRLDLMNPIAMLLGLLGEALPCGCCHFVCRTAAARIDKEIAGFLKIVPERELGPWAHAQGSGWTLRWGRF